MTNWQVVAAMASAVSAAMACIAAALSWRSGRRAERMFELQRRPWLRLIHDPGHRWLDLKSDDTRMAWLLIENFGSGGAHETRVGARLTAYELPVHERSRLWSSDSTTLEWRGEQLLLCSPGERIPHRVIVPWTAPQGRVYLHAFCEYRGSETRQRYYSETVWEVTSELKLLRYYQGRLGHGSSVVYDAWKEAGSR